jgi:hypothetical protein
MAGIDESRNRIDDEVERTLASLDGLDDIEAGHWFDTRLRQRLANLESRPSSWLNRWAFSRRLSWVVLMALLILALNVGTGWMVAGDRGKTRGIDEAGIEAIASDYSLAGAGVLSDLSRER